MSDLKTVRTPCCCRQRRRTSDTPFIYGRTAVDLNSCVGPLLAVGLVVFVSFRTNEEGYPFETSTDDKCFFSSEITDGFVVRCLARSHRLFTIPRFTD